QVVEGLRKVPITIGMKLSLEGNHSTLLKLGCGIIAKCLVHIADSFADVGLDGGLVGEVGADALHGLVENFFQDCGVAAFGDFGASAFKHVFKELDDLPALGGFGLGRLRVCLR